MRKTFLLVSVFGSLLVSCGDSVVPAALATTVPTPRPMVTASPPTLIKEIELETQTGTAYTLEWSPDGEMLAVASGYEITLLSNDLNEPYTVLEPEDGALAITWNPDQTKFATVFGYRNPTIKLWDWDGNNRLAFAREIQANSDQYGVFWSPDGKLLATLADDDKSTFQIWDASTGAELHRYELPYAYPLRTSSWSADSATLYAAGESSGQIFIYGLDVADGSVREVAKVDAAKAAVFALSSDAKVLAIGDERGVVEFLDLASGKVFAEIKTVDQPVDLGWSPDGGSLAVLGYKTTLQLWDTSP